MPTGIEIVPIILALNTINIGTLLICKGKLLNSIGYYQLELKQRRLFWHSKKLILYQY